MENHRIYEYIARSLSEEAVLEQLVEECGELVSAASKRLRILRGENYTPVSREANFDSLVEECVDVEVCLRVAEVRLLMDGDYMENVRRTKTERWCNRLLGTDL